MGRRESRTERPGLGTAAGLRIVARSAVLRAILLGTTTLNPFNYMFAALFVLYVTTELDVSPGVLGLIIGAGSVQIVATPETMLAVVSGFKRSVNYGIRPVGVPDRRGTSHRDRGTFRPLDRQPRCPARDVLGRLLPAEHYAQTARGVTSRRGGSGWQQLQTGWPVASRTWPPRIGSGTRHPSDPLLPGPDACAGAIRVHGREAGRRTRRAHHHPAWKRIDFLVSCAARCARAVIVQRSRRCRAGSFPRSRRAAAVPVPGAMMA